jgi:DNA-binding LacI/PurR family transcriptional regulator
LTQNQARTGLAGPATLDEVAALAGVSRATVSRVLNDSPSVSRKARGKVERAVAELGYVPNRAARSLRTRRTELIALVFHEPESRVTTDPVLGGMIRGIGNALANTDFQPVLLMISNQAQHERVERYVLGGDVDGVLLVSMHGHDPLVDKLVRAGLPAVLSGRPLGPTAISYVNADNRGGGREATSYLIGRGRRRIATIAGPQEMCAGIDRLDGYHDALRAARQGVDESLIEVGDFTEEGGEGGMRRLLARCGGPGEGGVPDAVFAANDLMAVGALRALKAAGLRVPEDVALVGFDDSDAARHSDPQLTTVSQPIEEQGRQMVQRLLAVINGDTSGVGVLLDTKLVVRQSA